LGELKIGKKQTMTEVINTEVINEYRCTRQRYGKPEDCQGYYIEAVDEQGARARMAKKFPEDVDEGWGFSVELWKTDSRKWERIQKRTIGWAR
jgi:hypothetical protein